jgi:two-component system chemotaxis response regulator CheB
MSAVTRVLVIDDSVVVRRLVTRALEREPTVTVVAAMRNSRAAVVRAETLRPDVVLLDSEVAGEDGCPTLVELRRHHPDLRAVMRGEGAGLSEERVRRELLPEIRGRGARPASPGRRRSRTVTEAAEAVEPAEAVALAEAVDPAEVVDPGRRTEIDASTRAPLAVQAIVVAASTGGPDALAMLLAGIPAELPVPLIVVQHMPAEFTTMLATRLDRGAALQVSEAVAGERVRAGHVYIAPGGRHLVVESVPDGVVLAVHDGPRENSCRPAADVLFRSAAAVYGAGLLAVVLTGMGRDGLRGTEAVRRAGGRVLAQSTDSSVIASMPGAVAAAGLASEIVDLEAIGSRLTGWVTDGR